MKKFIYSIATVIVLTIIWILLFELSICYPEHGTDGIGFCARSSMVYLLWKNGNIIRYSLLALSGFVIFIQSYTFKNLIQNNFGVSSFLLSLAIPLSYALLILFQGEITSIPSELDRTIINKRLLWVLVLSQMANLGIWALKGRLVKSPNSV